MSRVNSSSFSNHLVSHVTAVPFISPALPLFLTRWKLVARHTICPLPSSRSQGVRDIPSHENLIANPAETPGSCYKSFRELTSTVHENYEREDACKHRKNNRERLFWYIRNILQKFYIFCKICHCSVNMKLEILSRYKSLLQAIIVLCFGDIWRIQIFKKYFYIHRRALFCERCSST